MRIIETVSVTGVDGTGEIAGSAVDLTAVRKIYSRENFRVTAGNILF